ncbi:MAG: anaerobic ribonucleoside-triphosphate reductase activating protein [Candidatus Cloacimonetes bacterium]|jgi:pyruvate formate lyase activating enzyme|nr:anaerobic ribonucleoside-triphosphate reductase activating protein [Candidatus Cloacimonadota bacterium]
MVIGGLQKSSLIDYPGKVTCIIFTQGCNFACPWCHNGSLLNQSKESLISEKTIFEFLNQRINLLDAVTITGGEPTIQKKLIPFLYKLRKLPFLIKLDTNGYNPKVLNEIVANKLVDYVAMDVKAPLHKYSLLTNTAVNVTLIKESIQIIKQSGIDYEFRTTYVAGLLNENDLVTISQEIDPVKKWVIQEFKPEKSVDKVSIFKSYPQNFNWFNIKNKLKKTACEQTYIR